MKKTIISVFLLVAISISAMPTSVLADSYAKHIQKQIKSSCQAFKDPAQNSRNIQRLEKINQKDVERLTAQEQKIAQVQEEILSLEAQVQVWQSEDSTKSANLAASGQRRLQTLTERITAYEEKAQLYRKQIEEMTLFIQELKNALAPRFCLEIYQAENERLMEREAGQKQRYEDRARQLTDQIDRHAEIHGSRIDEYEENITALRTQNEQLGQEIQIQRQVAASAAPYEFSDRFVNRVCHSWGDPERNERNRESLRNNLQNLQKRIDRYALMAQSERQGTKEKGQELLEQSIFDHDDLTRFIGEMNAGGRPSYCTAIFIKDKQKQIDKNNRDIEKYEASIKRLREKLELISTKLQGKQGEVDNIIIDKEEVLVGLTMLNQGYGLMADKAAKSVNNSGNHSPEDRSESNFGIDPNKIDSDGDGLPDVMELNFGTDPFDPDSDGDGYLDGVEIEYGYNPLGVGKMIDYKNPYAPVPDPSADIKKDSDSDGLPDAIELNFGTDPFNPDSDGDGYSDGEELRKGFNPLGKGRMSEYKNPYAPGQAKKKAAEETTYRGEHRGFTAYNSLTRADFEYMRAQGISQVRIMFMDGDLVKASHLQDPDNLDPAILPENLEQLDRLVGLGREYGVRLVIDVHEIPGLTRWFTGGDKIRDMSMWEQNAHGKNYRDLLIDIWEQLARHLQDEPAEAVSYELMNEPEPKTDFAPREDRHWLWTDLQDRLIQVIRQHDQTHLIFATPAYGWRLSALQEWFPSETVMNDPNLAVSIHSARPFKYVYQALAWYGSAEYAAYPGYFDEEHYGYEYWDRERLSQLFSATIGKFYQQYGLKIYICEFSVMREAPGAATYFEDLISLMNRDFSEAIWGWTAHVYGEAEYVTGKGLIYDTSRPGMYDFSHDPELLTIVLAGISSKTTKK